MTCVVFIKNWKEIVQSILFKLLQAFSVLHLKLIKILNYKFRKKELSSCVLGYSSSLSPIRGLNNVVAKLYQVNKSAGRVRCSLELTYHLVNPLEGSTNQEPRGGRMKILSSLPNIWHKFLNAKCSNKMKVSLDYTRTLGCYRQDTQSMENEWEFVFFSISR